LLSGFCQVFLITHIPADLHTTTPLFRRLHVTIFWWRECRVMVFWCILASLGTVGECINTWLKLESPMQREETSTQRECRPYFWWSKNPVILLGMIIKT
jgi:hypothetical protein